MKKVLNFLEANVQWVAVALGAIYLVFMAYTYIFQSPVHVEVSGKNLGPGDIDKYIYDNPVQLLSSRMLDSNVPPPVPKPEWLKEFKSAMDFSDQKPAEFASKPWIKVIPIPGAFKIPGEQVVQDPAGGDRKPVEELPLVPPAIMGSSLAMASTVTAPGAGGANPVDKNIAVIAFTLSNKALTDAYKAVKMPFKLYAQTCELEVKLFRQQQKSDGSWEDEKEIKRLPFDVIQPTPPESATMDQKRAFANWAKDSQKAILQPTFYDVVSGDHLVIPPAVPQAPVEAKPAEPVVEGLPNFDPNKWDYTLEEIKQMTPEQRKQFQAAKKKHDDEERQRRANSRPKGGGAGKGKGGGAVGGRVIDDPDRPNDAPPDTVPNPYAPEQTFLRQPRDDRDRPPTPPAPPQPQPEAQGQPNEPAAASAPTTQPEHPCPGGLFDPSRSPDWIGWAFDETIEPGKTYHYRVQYSIRNPLFEKPRDCARPEMAKVLVLPSDIAKTEWTLPLKVPARTSFYIAKSPMDGANTVQFEVYAWSGGAKRKKMVEVGPGDMIGGMDNGVDFTTGSTLVDIVADPRNTGHPYVLVADPSGAIARRDFASDQANPELQNDRRAVVAMTTP